MLPKLAFKYDSVIVEASFTRRLDFPHTRLNWIHCTIYREGEGKVRSGLQTECGQPVFSFDESLCHQVDKHSTVSIGEIDTCDRFLTMRRCLMLATIICQYAINGKVPEKVQSITTLLVCTGALISGYETINANLFGVCIVWMNNFSTSMFDVSCEKFNNRKQVTVFELNLCFSIIAGIFTLIYTTIFTDEIFLITDGVSRDGLIFCVKLIGSGMCGFGLTIFRLITLNLGGSNACNITAIVKDVLLTFVGFIAFANVHVSATVLSGLAISFAGVCFQLIMKM